MAPILPQVLHANLGFINMITYENFVKNGDTETIPVFFDVCYEIRRFFLHIFISQIKGLVFKIEILLMIDSLLLNTYLTQLTSIPTMNL